MQLRNRAAATLALMAFTSFLLASCSSNAPTTGNSNHASNAANRANNKSVAYVYNFFAKWCDDCHALESRLTRLEDAYGDKVQVVNVNIDTKDSSALVRKYGIETIPTLVVLNKDRSHVTTLRGPHEGRQIGQLIEGMFNARAAKR